MLSLADKGILKGALETSITIPKPLADEFRKLVDYALEQDSKKNREEVSKLSEELKGEYDPLRDFLNPYYINMLKLTGTTEGPATIGEVQTYFIELLTGEKKTSTLETSIAQCPVGSLPKHESLTLLSRNANQVPLLEYLIEWYHEFAKRPFDKEYKNWSELFSIEEWTLIRNQCSTPLILTDVDSNLFDNLMTILKSSDLNVNDESILEFKILVVEHSNNRIESLKNDLNDLKEPSRFGRPCEYRSSTKEQILANLSLDIEDKPHVKNFLGAILSTLPKSDWTSFLTQIGFKKFGEGEFTLNYHEAGLIFRHAPVVVWKDLAELPGLMETIKNSLKQDGIITVEKITELLNIVFYRHRFELEKLFGLSEWVNSQNQSSISVLNFIHRFPVDRWAATFRSKGFRILLNQVQKPNYLHFCYLLRWHSQSLRDHEVLCFMNSWFARKHGILGNEFFVRPLFLSFASPFMTDWLKMGENMKDFCYTVKTFCNLMHLLRLFSHRPEIKKQLLENTFIKVNLSKDAPDALILAELMLELNDTFSAYIKEIDNKNIDNSLLELAHETAQALATARSDQSTTNAGETIATIYKTNQNSIFIRNADSFLNLQSYLQVYACLQSPDLERFLALLPKSQVLNEYSPQKIEPEFKKLGPDHLHKFMLSEGVKMNFGSIVGDFRSIIFKGLKNKLHNFLDDCHEMDMTNKKPETRILIKVLDSHFCSLEEADEKKFFIEELFKSAFLSSYLHYSEFPWGSSRPVYFSMLLENYSPGNLITLIARHPNALEFYKNWILTNFDMGDFSRMDIITPHVATADLNDLKIFLDATDAAFKEKKNADNSTSLIKARWLQNNEQNAEKILNEWKKYLPASSKYKTALNNVN